MSQTNGHQREMSSDVEIRVDDQYEKADHPTAPSKLDRAKFISQKFKDGAKSLLNRGADSDHDYGHELFEDAAFNPQLILEASPHNRGSLRDRLNRGAKLVADGAKNPKRAIRDRYTRNAAAKVSRQPRDYADVYDEALLNAHEALLKAQMSSAGSQHDGGSDVGDNDEIEVARRRVDEIEEQRNSHRSAWILGRHVVRVKAIRPVTHKPLRSEFTVSSSPPDQPPRTQWHRYLGYFLLWYTSGFTAHHIDDYREPPFDLRELALAIERVAVVSTPWQALAVNIRRLYRWDNPQRTLRVMTLFWILWYLGHIATFMIGWIIYFVVQNKFHPTSVRRIRERILRSRDDNAKAQAWSEMIKRHGDRDWIEPLLDEIGPLIQMQLGDLADFMEILQNFYRWERPGKTTATLFFFFSCFLLSLLTSVDFCVRLFWFGAGSLFFFSFPISARYPNYRRLVNPLCWVFWDIPNAAELAIIHLQEKALVRDARQKTLIEQRRRSQEGSHDDVSFAMNVSSPSSSETSSDSDAESMFSTSPNQSSHNTDQLQPYKTPHTGAQDGVNSSSLTLPSFISTGSCSSSYSRSHSPVSKNASAADLNSRSMPSLLTPIQSSPFYPKSPFSEAVTFRTVLHTTETSHLIPHIHAHSHCRLTLTRRGIWLYNAHQLRIFHPYATLLEMRKIDLNAEEQDNPASERKKPVIESVAPGLASGTEKLMHKTAQTIRKVSKWTALQFLPSGLEFVFMIPSNDFPTSSTSSTSEENEKDHEHAKMQVKRENFTVIVSESDRSKIFSLVLSWSDLKWQPCFSMGRQNKLASSATSPTTGGKRGKGNRALDDAIKMALR